MTEARRLRIPLPAVAVALALGVSIPTYEYIQDQFDDVREVEVVDPKSMFCRDFLDMTPERQAGILVTKASSYVASMPDRKLVRDCLFQYARDRTPAVVSSCRHYGDFNAGKMLGAILATGLRVCRDRNTGNL